MTAAGFFRSSPQYEGEQSAAPSSITRRRPSRQGADVVDNCRLSAWSWCGPDPYANRDLVFVVATYSRGEVGWVCRRARLPRPSFRARLRPLEPGFAAAMEQPFQLRWMPLDEFAHGSHQWRGEDQLASQ